MLKIIKETCIFDILSIKFLGTAKTASFILTFLLLVYACFVSLFFRSQILTSIPPLLYIIAFCICLFIIRSPLLNLLLQLDKRNFLILIAITFFALRLGWFYLTKPEPFSDFLLYHNFAVQMSQGNFSPYDQTCVVFPHRYSYSMILSLLYKVTGPSFINGVMLNIFLSFFTCFFILRIGEALMDEDLARICALIFTIWPSQIMYSSVLASEHCFLFFLFLSMLLFINSIEPKKYENNLYKYIQPLLAGAVLGLAQFVRPVAIVFLIGFLLLFVFNRDFNKNILIILLLVAGYFAVLYPLKAMVSGMSGTEYKSTFGYNLLVGTNYKSTGYYNNEDASILSRCNYNIELIHEKALSESIGRIKNNPSAFVDLANKKYISFWGDGSFGAYWSIKGIKNSNYYIVNTNTFRKLSFFSCQVFYQIILGFSAYGLYLCIREKNYVFLIVCLIFLFHAGMYTFLEIQSRYHYPAVASLLFPAGWGIIRFYAIKPNQRRSLSQYRK